MSHFTPIQPVDSLARSGFRVMGWNFLEGGLSPADGHGRRTPLVERRAAAQVLVARLSPNVLVINEALGCTPGTDPYTDYAQLFGYPYGVAMRYDEAWGNAIVSRHPVIEVRQGLLYSFGAPNNRGWLAARIQTPDGPVWVGTYHPHPCRSPKLRRLDVAHLLDLMTEPAVFVGDLNAVSLDPGIDESALRATFARLQTPDRASYSASLFYHSGRLLFHPEDGLFPQRGWRSALDDPRPTIPTALVRQPGDRGLHIDHILMSPGVEAYRGWVEHAPEADEASDHYPVVADLKLPGPGPSPP